ncbi:MAG TPA: PHP domain-containing protein [Longimicrobiaceae bacterium]
MTALPLGTPASLGTQDLHVHTTMSDGEVPLEEVVRIAADRGVAVGIADHVSTRNPSRFVATLPQLHAYLEAIEAQPVYVAAEFCWCDPFAAQLPAEIMDRFHYRIGSNHGFALPGGGWGSPWWTTLPPPWDDRPQELMEHMVANLCDLVRTMPIEIVAHSTFMPAALLDLEGDVHAWWTEEREDRFVEAVVRSSVAIEISSRYRLPHDRLLRKALEAGARFSLGSDGHRASQVANLDWALQTARRVGIGEREMFVPGEWRRS